MVCIQDYIADEMQFFDIGDISSLMEDLKKYYTERTETISNSERTKSPNLGNFPMGIWFRGQADKNWLPIPRVYRQIDNQIYNETGLLISFQLKYPEHTILHKQVFDWLSLMQHYGLPTRLLDWSESFLVALFFAVSSHPNSDARIYIVDARRLNEEVSREVWLSNGTHKEFEVIVRAAMSNNAHYRDFVNEYNDLKRIGSYYRNIPELDSKEFEEFQKPQAVLPFKTNDRLRVQHGTFTFHGGKKIINSIKDNSWPKPIELLDVNKKANKKFMTSLIIPKAKKKNLLELLYALGIHEASLFPEMEYQGKHLAKQWLSSKR